MSDTAPEKNSPFEILAALLLGLAAVATAWSSYQAGQWSGKSDEAFAHGNKVNAEFGQDLQLEFSELVRDSAIDRTAKQRINEAAAMGYYRAQQQLESDEEPTPEQKRQVMSDAELERREALLMSARYLYGKQLSMRGYDYLGLPAGYHEVDEDESADGDMDEDGAPDMDNDPIGPEGGAPSGVTWVDLEEADLLHALQSDDLNRDYFSQHLDEFFKRYQDVEKHYEVAAEHGEKADAYDLITVLLTVSLFFAGIAQVFKTRVKWPLLGLGGLTFAVAMVQMLAAG